jgi:hypothetical protein
MLSSVGSSRRIGRLRGALFDRVDGACTDLGTEHVADLDGWLPSRAIALQGDGVLVRQGSRALLAARANVANANFARSPSVSQSAQNQAA